MVTNPLILRHLNKNYESTQAVKDVSLEVHPGEILGLLGPNGAGKTTLISVLVTLEQPTSGEVIVFGHNVVTHPQLAKSYLGFVPQELINHGYFNVLEILKFHAGFFGVTDSSAHIEFLLRRLQLWEHRNKKVKQLSGGMRRRLAIAKAMVHKPKLLLLDEPTAGVDIELRQILWDFVRELKSQGLSILLTTHYLEEAEQLCDRVAIIDHGRILRTGDTKQLVRELTFKTFRLKLKNGLGQIKHPWLVEQTASELVFRVPSERGLGDLLTELSLDMRLIQDIAIEEGTLEDAFRHIVRGSHA